MGDIDPEVVAFVRFCVHRRSQRWPDIYDEMCRVAGRRLFKGFGYAELSRLGLSLSLDVLDKTAMMVEMATNTDA